MKHSNGSNAIGFNNCIHQLLKRQIDHNMAANPHARLPRDTGEYNTQTGPALHEAKRMAELAEILQMSDLFCKAALEGHSLFLNIVQLFLHCLFRKLPWTLGVAALVAS